MAILEIAVLSQLDALRTREGGAHSIEVLADLLAGGITPSHELVQASRETAINMEVNVMVRPRPGNFVYNEAERDVIFASISAFRTMGVDTLVFGALQEDSQLDLALMRAVADVAAPVPITLHRALDNSAAPEEALNALIGVLPRVLTAGPAPDAWQGREVTRRWVEQYHAHFTFVLSGGIPLEKARELAEYTGAHTLHFGGAARSGGDVDLAKVRALAEQLQPV